MTDILLKNFTYYLANMLMSNGIYYEMRSYISRQYGEDFTNTSSNLKFISDTIEDIFYAIDVDFDDVLYEAIEKFLKDEDAAIWTIENCPYDKLYGWVYLGKVYSPSNDIDSIMDIAYCIIYDTFVSNNGYDLLVSELF